MSNNPMAGETIRAPQSVIKKDDVSPAVTPSPTPVEAPFGVDGNGQPLQAQDFHMQGTLSNRPLGPDETRGLNEWTKPKPTK